MIEIPLQPALRYKENVRGHPLSDEQARNILRLYYAGESLHDIMRRTGHAWQTIQNYVAAHEAKIDAIAGVAHA